MGLGQPPGITRDIGQDVGERKPVFDPAVPGTNRRTVASVLDPTERDHAGSQCGSEGRNPTPPNAARGRQERGSTINPASGARFGLMAIASAVSTPAPPADSCVCRDAAMSAASQHAAAGMSPIGCISW